MIKQTTRISKAIRQESKSAGSHKQEDMGKAGVQKSYKATTRKESENTSILVFTADDFL